jgi:hypothetical protein
LITTCSVRDARSEAVELAFVAAVLAELVREVGDEALLARRDLERVGEHRRRAVLARGDDTVRGNDVRVVAGRAGELHLRKLDRAVDEGDTLADRADRLAVRERLADPVDDTAVLRELGGVLAARDDQAVEHGRALALEVVVRPDRAGAARRLDLATTRANDPRNGLGREQKSLDRLDLGEREAVRDEDGDTARLDRRHLRRERSLRKVRRALAVVRADGCLGNSAADVRGDLLGELVVDVVEDLERFELDQGQRKEETGRLTLV